MYFRHGVSSATFGYLHHYTWWAATGWLRDRHPRLGWRTIKRRFLTGSASRPAENGTVLYNPQEIAIERYRYRGNTIPTPWTYAAAHLDTANTGMTSMESRMR